MITRSGLGPNESLRPGEYLVSSNKKYVLVLQTDGNLVLYSITGAALWSSRTVGQRPAWCLMQADGNFVMYDALDQPLWSSNTAGSGGRYLVMQDDGNLVLYGQGPAKWATNSH